MMQRINESQTAYLHRSSAWLVGGFAALALLLGVVGLYGVIAYSVSQRTREIGVRMALGAQQSSVYRMILKEAGWLTGVGIVAGLLCSIAVATLMRKLLFGIHTWDVSDAGRCRVAAGRVGVAGELFPGAESGFGESGGGVAGGVDFACARLHAFEDGADDAADDSAFDGLLRRVPWGDTPESGARGVRWAASAARRGRDR